MFKDLYEVYKKEPGVNYIGSLPQKELAQELKKNTFLIYPTNTEETFCLSIAEAMAAGCLVIANDKGAIKEITGDYAKIVNIKDYENEENDETIELIEKETKKEKEERIKKEYLLKKVSDTFSIDFFNHFSNEFIKYYEWYKELDIIDSYGNNLYENYIKKQIHFINKTYNWDNNAKTLLQLEDDYSDNIKELYTDGKYEECKELCEKVILKHYPRKDKAYNYLSIIYLLKKDYESAFYLCNYSIKLNMYNPLFKNNMGLCYLGLGNKTKAIEEYKKAISIDPNNDVFYENLSYISKHLPRKKLNNLLKKSISLNPNKYLPRMIYIDNFLLLNKYKRSIKELNKALEIHPNNLVFLLRRYLSCPLFFTSYKKENEFYINLNKNLRKLKNIKINEKKYIKISDIFLFYYIFIHDYKIDYTRLEMIDMVSNIYKNNYKQLIKYDISQDKYLKKIKTLKLENIKSEELKSKDNNSFIKIAFFTDSKGNGPPIKLIRGLIIELNKIKNKDLTKKYEIHLYYDKTDVIITKDFIIQELTHNVVKHIGYDYDIGPIQNTLLEEQYDVIVYTSVQYRFSSYALQFGRFAPIQIAHVWGHPMTSGNLSQLDYVISMEGELENAQEYYGEKLIKFNNLSTYYYKPTIHDPEHVYQFAKDKKYDISDFDSDDINAYTLNKYTFQENNSEKIINLQKYKDDNPNIKIYSCIQSIWKLHPKYIELLLRILIEDRNGIIILLKREEVFYKKLLKLIDNLLIRLKEENNLSNTEVYDIKERVIHFPQFYPRKYLAFFQYVDVFLDPFPWCGGLTSFDAFAMGVPTITFPTKYLSGRFTYIMYDRMKISEKDFMNNVIVNNNTEYVKNAVLIANNKELNLKIREFIKDKSSILFENKNVIKEWDNFITNKLFELKEKIDDK